MDIECIVIENKGVDTEPWNTGTLKSQSIEELLQRLRRDR